MRLFAGLSFLCGSAEIDVDGDHKVSPHGTANRNWQRIDESAVDKVVPVDARGGEDAGDADAGADRIEQAAGLENNLLFSLKVGGDGGVRNMKAGDGADIDNIFQKMHDILAR